MILAAKRFTPRRISTCRVWFDGSDPNNGVLPSSGSLIQTITNKGWATGVTCTQSTPLNQATYIANQYNGKGILRTTGSQWYSVSGYTYNNNYTVFGVFIPGTASAYISSPNEIGAFITKFNNGSGVQNYEWYHDTVSVPTVDRGTFSTGGTGMNIVELVQSDGVSCAGYFNGNAAFSFTPTESASGSSMAWLLAASSGGSWYTGDFAAFLIFNSNLSAAIRYNIRHFLGDYWGVSVV